MRMIDADALDYMLSNAQAECKCNGGNFRFGVLSNVRENIAKFPSIDAIPVEWLEQQFYDNPKSQWAEKCRDVYTKWQKWQQRQWQKEQEAR